MVTQSTRGCGMVYSVSVLWSSWGHVDAGVRFIQACQESWPWGSAGSMQPLMAQPGVPGTLTRSSRVNASAILPVQRVQCRDRRGEQQHLCSARGCNGSGVWDDPEMAAPGAALPGNGYTVPGRSEVVSGDGCSLSVRWGALWCSHPGSHSVPSRLGPGGSRLCVPISGRKQTRLQPCRQHFWPRGQSLSCRHRRRHLAA